MSDPFASGGNSGVKFTSFEGNLVLVYGTEYLTGDDKVKTENGEKDVVVADVVVLDGEEGPEEHSGLYIFPTVLIGTLKRHVGKRPYLGRLTKGSEKKNGNLPWIFQEPTEEDKAAARKYIDEKAAKSEDPFAA